MEALLRELVTPACACPQAIDPLKARSELTRFWEATKRGEKEQGLQRLCTLNLIVVNSTQELGGLGEDLTRLCQHFPARVFVVALDSASDAVLKAWVGFGCREGGEQICREQFTLLASTGAQAQLPSLLSPLFKPDLPTFLWFRGVPALEQPAAMRLVDLADRIVLDSRRGGRVLEALLAMIRDPYRQEQAFSDLEWRRLERWRNLVAALFDKAEGAADLRRARRVTISWVPDPSGSRSAPLYMAGWLASRLGWRVETRLEGLKAAWMSPSGPVELEVVAGNGSQVLQGRLLHVRVEADGACYEVRRKPDNPEVYVSHIHGTTREDPDTDTTIHFAERQILMGAELETIGRVKLFEDSLEAALQLAGSVVTA